MSIVLRAKVMLELEGLIGTPELNARRRCQRLHCAPERTSELRSGRHARNDRYWAKAAMRRQPTERLDIQRGMRQAYVRFSEVVRHYKQLKTLLC